MNKPVGFFDHLKNADPDDAENPKEQLEYELTKVKGQLYWSQADVQHIAENYGFDEWTYPDAGDDASVFNFGGGDVNNDRRFIDELGQSARYGYNIPEEERVKASALHYLNHYREQHGEKPFFLVVSLVNPHDVLSYPGTAKAAVTVQVGNKEKKVRRYNCASFAIGISRTSR